MVVIRNNNNNKRHYDKRRVVVSLRHIVMCVTAVAGAVYTLVAWQLYPQLFQLGRRDNKKNAGYETWQQRVQVPLTQPLQHKYLTLWLHQVHRWFGSDEQGDRITNVRSFLQQARDVGYTAVMTDLPWEWTERDEPDQLDLTSVNKDWIQQACDLGLQVQVVISMRDLPPWMWKVEQERNDTFTQKMSPACHKGDGIPMRLPCPAHPYVWERILRYTQNAAVALVQQYGSNCIHSLSPTMNNEFETRYSQMYSGMLDYSSSMATQYKKWQVDKGVVAPLVQEPRPFPCGTICEPFVNNNAVWNWLAFREDFLAQKYIELCQAIKQAVGADMPTFLHFGENLATTGDFLNSNIFFQVARSAVVDELIMDSNMMLAGAASSPSAVGVIVSLAQVYNKKIHFEIATERVIKCNDVGRAVVNNNMFSPEGLQQGSFLMIRSGIQNSLEAAIDSFGVTNLCQPSLTAYFMPSDGNNVGGAPPSPNIVAVSTSNLNRAPRFRPTAILFVPYRAFYSHSIVTSGVRCDKRPTPCWHSSFSQVPVFVDGHISPGTCPVDVFQLAVLKAWDDLRTRHEHVAVIGDVQMLQDRIDLVRSAKEREAIRFPCIMNDDMGWQFYNGRQDREIFQTIHQAFPFRGVVATEAC